MYVSEYDGRVVRKILSSGGIVTMFAGTVTDIDGDAGDGGKATSVRFVTPYSVEDDGADLADFDSSRIRTVSLTTGIITLFAGTGPDEISDGDNNPASAAGLFNPTCVFVAANGAVFISDYNGNRIRMVDTSAERIITTIAGSSRARTMSAGSHLPI